MKYALKYRANTIIPLEINDIVLQLKSDVVSVLGDLASNALNTLNSSV